MPSHKSGVVDPQLNKAQIEEALGVVADELTKKKHQVKIVAVGGAINTILLGKLFDMTSFTLNQQLYRNPGVHRRCRLFWERKKSPTRAKGSNRSSDTQARARQRLAQQPHRVVH
jgi:hypothetical protein